MLEIRQVDILFVGDGHTDDLPVIMGFVDIGLDVAASHGVARDQAWISLAVIVFQATDRTHV
ncbi:hypothetical protein D3C78_1903110 [compost metagenome]